jgi:hypothetical protein
MNDEMCIVENLEMTEKYKKRLQILLNPTRN